MVLKASAANLPPRPTPEDTSAPVKKGKKASLTP
jgi:hypothetical protein